ncbi:hypothetical protein AB0D04_12740 [Streptomyces sp. NPDC048483]|uniref:hypothetical protein n=1 Tax=Streptomyces sp. NPDC048483 TaxID=3154927 RepID=UPI003417209E
MPDLPDYFDRLLARHTPTPADGPLPGVPGIAPDDGRGRPALVRPRLPGPFERIEALRADDGEGGEGRDPALTAPPSRLQPPLPGPLSGRVEREVRVTERETVVRTEADARGAAEGAEGALRPSAPLLRPAAPLTPTARPAAAEPVRPRRRAEASGDDDGTAERSLAPVTVSPGGETTRSSPRTPLQPRRDDAAAARGAARQAAAGRRGGRPAERVVHVQIGRLEVTAAGGQDRTAAARPDRTVRRGPALSLADYLSRDEKRN